MKSTTGKVLASVALVGTAAAVAGLGTYGAFTDSTTTVDQQVTAGTVNIDLANATAFATPVAGMLPGDKAEKLVTLQNSGNSGFNSVTLTTKLADNATPTLLTSDATHGLKLTIETCSVPWTGIAAPYICVGSKTVLAETPIIGDGLPKALSNLTSLAPAGSDYLKITTLLPSTAGNDFQGKSTTVNFMFTATQRAATTS